MKIKKPRYYILAVIFFLSVAQTFAEDIDPKKTRKTADTYFLHEAYRRALPLYLQLYALQPDNIELNYRIGLCYLQTITKGKAIFYLDKVQTLDVKNKYDELEHFLGLAYQSVNMFDKAIEHYEIYKKKLDPKSEQHAEALYDNNRFIEQCKAGKELSKNPVKNLQIEHLGSSMNSSYSESFPLISANEDLLFFSSNREGSTGGLIHKYTEEFYEDIYYCKKVASHWNSAKKLKGDINSNYDELPIAISHDTRKLYVVTFANSHEGDILISEFHEDSSWTKPVPIDDSEINSEEWETSAFISTDGKTLYFSSAREGGYGGSDLYKSTYNKGAWSKAVNLGPTINTPYNEESPFLMNNGKKLCFSSQGHYTMGGYDLFTSNIEQGNKYSTPVNLGYPINTAGDEVRMSWSADGKRGYYAVNREENLGAEDIFIVHIDDGWIPPVIPEENKVSNITRINSGLPTDEQSQVTASNKTTSLDEIVKTSADKIVSNKESSAIEVKAAEEKPVEKEILSASDEKTGKSNKDKNKKDKKNQEAQVAPEKTGEVKKESKNEELTQTKAEEIKPEVKAQTSTIGEVKQKEIKKGTKTEEPNLVKDSETKSAETPQELGKVEGQEHIIVDKPIEAPAVLTKMHNKTVGRPKTGQVFNEMVHWGYNGSNYITEYSRHKLEHVLEVLNKYPDIYLEIDGYTDDMDSDEYNLLISLKRAKTVADYLISQGIDPNRIVSVRGLGTANKVTQDSDVANAVQNRRAELKVVAKP